MTNRQHLLRRARMTVTGIIFFLIAVGALLTSYRQGYVLSFVFAVIVAAVVLAAFWSLFEIPCLNCRKSLGTIGFRVANGQMRNASPQCPHCGVGLDEIVPRRD